MEYVYVLDKNGSPLMPTSRCGKVRRLLRDGKAKIVRREPFTIQLLKEITNNTQPASLGVDTGSIHIGVATIGNSRTLYKAEVTIRNDVKKKMDDKRKYRRGRRNRKTRHRKPRFLNRGNSKRMDRYSPTLISKFQAHIREIEFVKSILPITQLVLELGQFDPHALKDPSVRNEKWKYQQGVNYGYQNIRHAILARDNYTCQNCGIKDSVFEVHHLVFRSQGGSDDSDNLITLCRKCHKDYHNGKIELKKLGKKKNFGLAAASQMNVLRNMLQREYPEAEIVYGYQTKVSRELMGLEKSHINDAIAIAAMGELDIDTQGQEYIKRVVPNGDRILAKGVRGERSIPKRKIKGFHRYDKIEYLGEEYFIKGRMSSGFATLSDINGNKADFSHMTRGWKTPKLENCIRVKARSSVLCIRVDTAQSTV